jgi:hypothetical protein
MFFSSAVLMLDGSAAFHANLFRVLPCLRKLFMPSYKRRQFIRSLKVLNDGLGVFGKQSVCGRARHVRQLAVQMESLVFVAAPLRG